MSAQERAQVNQQVSARLIGASAAVIVCAGGREMAR